VEVRFEKEERRVRWRLWDEGRAEREVRR